MLNVVERIAKNRNNIDTKCKIDKYFSEEYK
jgi:hypothetical protein